MREFLIVIVTLLLTGCASLKHNQSIYNELNGKEGIESIVDTFIQLVGKNEYILPYFAKSSVSHFRDGFITHLCDISGGPCKYNGDNMIDIHTGMKINEADFNRVVELLIQAMETNQIPYSTQNKLLHTLAPLRSEIIKI